jgi:hypothetical protein
MRPEQPGSDAMFFLIPKVTVLLLVIFALAMAFRHWRGTPRRRRPLWMRLLLEQQRRRRR